MRKKTVFISGHFNVLHPGHLRLLKFAKERGDFLVVGVESNKLAGTNAYVDEKTRLNSIRSITWVDKAFILRKSVNAYIKKNKPSIIVKGKEFENKFNEESKILKEYGGRLIFSSGEKMFSSFDLLRKEFQYFDKNIIEKPLSYLKRHSIKSTKIKKIISDFSKLKICVIGDLIIDEYITCEPLGMSQEDPTLVISPIDKIKFIGGAGIVAAHSSGLGAKVDLYSVAGNDEIYSFAKQKLSEYKVNNKIVLEPSRKTSLKQRYRSQGKTLMRVSYLDQITISSSVQQKIFKTLNKNIKKYDLVVFSDFNYGCLPKKLVEKIIELCKKNKIKTVADCQSSSQIGDMKKYRKMSLITPTEREARISTLNQDDGLIVLATELQKQTQAHNIILKLAGEGIIIHSPTRDKEKFNTDRVNALNNSPKDVAGAGDSLLISSSMSLASKGNIWESAYIGALSAALQVGRVGNTPLSKKELLAII